MPTQKPRVSFVISEDMKRDLDKLADSRRRSISNLISILVEDEIAKAKEDGEIIG